MWQNLTELIPKAAGKYNFAQTLKAVEICRACRALIKENLPPEAENNVIPKSYKDGVLVIGTSNPSWANQMQMASHRIQRGLTAKFGEKAVKRIRITPARSADDQPESGTFNF